MIENSDATSLGASTSEPSLDKAGSVSIERLLLLNNIGDGRDLYNGNYLVELNIREDIFSNFMSGEITISDSENLINEMPIRGEELLYVKLKTPTFENEYIEKIFKVYGIQDRIVQEQKQVYTLKFVSIEAFLDVNLPIFKAFEDKIGNVVNNVFVEFLSTTNVIDLKDNQWIEADSSACIIHPKIDEENFGPENNVRFVSPGWTPMKIINWLASKSIPPGKLEACNYLFFESNKFFYFTTLEYLFLQAQRNNAYIGPYYVSPSNIRNSDINGDTQGPNIIREMVLINDLVQPKAIDLFKNYMTGYLSNRLINLDFTYKKYNRIDYDHVEQWGNYVHVDNLSVPFFNPENKDPDLIVRNPASHISFYPSQSLLFAGKQKIKKNYDQYIGEIHGNRLSNMLELDNLRLEIVISGRTDIEVGSIMYISFPNPKPADEGDTVADREDTLFSGNYLVSAINHKITILEHKMICEVLKDGFYSKKAVKGKVE